MATVSVVGNVVRDPELRFGTNGGTAYAKFSIAVNRKKKRGDDWEEITSFFDVVCFGDMAENVASSLTKGTRVLVTGHLDVTNWEKDDKKGTAVQITADDIGPSLKFATTSISRNPSNGKEAF